MAKLIEAGCDWLTATTLEQEPQERAETLWEWMKNYEAVPSRLVRKTRMLGYDGERIEHAFYGIRKDGSMITVSSFLADEWAEAWIDAGYKATRLDLQVTVENGSYVQPVIEVAFEAACRFRPAAGRLLTVKKFTERIGATGLYVGSGNSETLLRMYDKGYQSKERVYKQCLRYEVQFRGRAARSVAGSLHNFQNSGRWAQALVYSNYKSRGIMPLFEHLDPEVTVPRVKRVSTIEGKMSWLKSQVEPTVQALIESVGWEKVADLLFPDRLTDDPDWNITSE